MTAKNEFIGVRLSPTEVEKVRLVANHAFEGNMSAALRLIVREARIRVQPETVIEIQDGEPPTPVAMCYQEAKPD